MNFVEKCRNYKYANIILALVFALTLFLQCCLFHVQAFNSIIISSLWKNPLYFITFYGSKISISLFIASFVLLFKRKSWIIYISFIIGIWSITELVYFRANGIFLDAYSFTMIGNMNGFWSSVPMYIYTKDFLIFIPSIILILAHHICSNKIRNYKLSIICFIVSTIFNISSCVGIVNWNLKQVLTINPFDDIQSCKLMIPDKTVYLKLFSNIHALIYDTKDLLLIPFTRETYTLSDKEINQAINFINNIPIIKKNVDSKIIIILVESFEIWSIDKKNTPNLFNFISNQSSILYASKIKTQTQAGTSADGQMIVNTGLLPISRGAVCYKYPLNTFPSLAKIYNTSSAIIPGGMSVWNQKYMSDSYGITSNYETSTNDADIFNKLIEIYPYNEYTLAITMSSHTPFHSCINRKIEVPATMPELMQNYLKTINYMDENLGEFLSLISKDSILQNSTIVITGDHTIFPSEIRKEFSDYCRTNNLDYKVEENYCPLIIYSPNIKEKTIVDEEAYQMDIYPTILHVIEAEDYYWKGFGVNLLDSVARKNRPISAEEAFELSDKIIRANYFNEIESQLSNN